VQRFIGSTTNVITSLSHKTTSAAFTVTLTEKAHTMDGLLDSKQAQQLNHLLQLTSMAMFDGQSPPEDHSADLTYTD